MKEVKDDEVKVHWLKKERKLYKPHMRADGSPFISVVPFESIMFADILLNTSSILDVNGPYMMENDVLKQILEEYETRDESINVLSEVQPEFSGEPSRFSGYIVPDEVLKD